MTTPNPNGELAHDTSTNVSNIMTDSIKQTEATAPSDNRHSTPNPFFGLPEVLGASRRAAHRLILCFDGTGNSFKGNSSDTNVVELYKKFDQCAPHQKHYYQRKAHHNLMHIY